MSQGSVVSATWALTESSKDVVSLSRGILQAATSDNIQVLALAATEAFGATVAISQRTLMVVEKAASRRDTSAVLKFIEAQIGWNSYDAAYHLAQSDAGLRFLGLAAALLTVDHPLQRSMTLEAMMQASARKNQLMPTLGQLQDLIAALAPKLCQTGFADKVVGSEILLAGLVGTAPFEGFRRRTPAETNPGPEEIAKLVATFTKVKRLGETDSGSADKGTITYLNIRSTSSYAWLLAFVEWCLGIPPNIVLENGRPLLTRDVQSNVVATLFLDEGHYNGNRQLSIEVLHSVHGPREFWKGSPYSEMSWSGHISIANYGRRTLLYQGLTDTSNYTVVSLAVAYILYCLQEKVLSPGISVEFSQYQTQSLPAKLQIQATYLKYMGKEMPPGLDRLMVDCRPVSELSIVSAELVALQTRCPCRLCSGDPSKSGQCLKKNFWGAILDISADILALALLENGDQPDTMINTAGPMHPARELFKARDVLDVIASLPSQFVEVDPVMIFQRALMLFGIPIDEREDMDDRSGYLACSASGQVLYLSVLDAPRLDGCNMLQIKHFSGQLQYRNDKYASVRGRSTPVRLPTMPREHVRTVCNLMSEDDRKLIWAVGRETNRLTLSTSLRSSTADPFHAILNHRSALYAHSCSHQPMKALDAPDDGAKYVIPGPDYLSKWPIDSSGSPRSSGLETQVVAVAGNDAQRFFALAYAGVSTKVVIRINACLECCLSLCRRAGYDAIIL